MSLFFFNQICIINSELHIIVYNLSRYMNELEQFAFKEKQRLLEKYKCNYIDDVITYFEEILKEYLDKKID